MANRLSSSQPVIIDTELSPLSDSFYLEANGQTEQWYYENTGVYAPDHSIIPLIITPHIEAKDLDTGIAHTPTLYPIEWYVKEWNGSAWVRTKVTNTIDNASQPYVLVGNTLKVHKNVTAPQYGITIECEASYADPRDSAVTYPVRDSLTLTMSRDATVLYPKIQVLAESAQSFNPLKDINYGNTPATGYYDFKAEADWKGVSSDNGSQLYKANALGTEEIVSRTGTLPTTTPIIGNLRYGRGTGSTPKENQSFMFRQTSGGTVNPVPQNLAGIEKLKGNTVVWNQYSPINNFSNTTTDTRSYFQLRGQWFLNDSYVDSAFDQQNITSGQSYKNIVTARSGINRLKLKHSGASSDIQICVTDSVIVPTHNILVFFTCKSANPSTVGGLVIENIGIFDLTLMFGAGNEPTTVAQFEAMFPEPYYAYDAGRLLSFNPAGLKTVGFNLWDEEWEVGGIMSGSINSKNFTKVIPNTTYYFRANTDGMILYFYDINKNEISSVVALNTTFTTPANCYFVKFRVSTNYGTTYHNDICLNLSDATKNGIYEAHWENTCPINITTLKGRANGSTTDVVMFPDGLKSAGSVFDEIDLKNGRAVKRIGKVDLGSITYAYNATHSTFYPNSDINELPTPISGGYDCKNVLYDSWRGTNADFNASSVDKVLALCNTSFSSSKRFFIKDTAYSNAATFKAAMNGVYLYYELETPIEYTFDQIPQGQFEWYGVSNGVEVRIDTLPSYVSGQGTDTLRVDALYDENMTVICRYKKYPWDSELIPQKEYRTVAWRVPNIDTIIVCKNGSSVNSASTGNYNFEVIVNANGETLSDEVIAANLRFRWKMRNSYTKQETDLGWGSQNDSSKIAIPVSSLRNATVNGEPVTTTVWCEVYMLGAYEPVTDNGVTTYQRLINNN